MTEVINLIGGPGIGKTTTCFSLITILKINNFTVEYLPEVAKELVWSKDLRINDQMYITQKTYKRLKEMVDDRVDFIVTDGSLLHGLYYNDYILETLKDERSYRIINDNDLLKCFFEFKNLVYLLTRNEKINFEQVGRIQNKEKSEMIDYDLEEILKSYGIEYKTIKTKKLKNKLRKTHAYDIYKDIIKIY